MIRLPQFMAALFVVLAVATAYPQNEMPVEISLKLDAKAKELFPDNVRAQDKWLTDNQNSYRLIEFIPVTPGNEAYFNLIKKRAEEKFPLDYISSAKFIQSMSDGLVMIDAYEFAFADKAEFKKMKESVLARNPEDYQKAAKEFEKQSQAIIEIGNIPNPESVSKEIWSAIKAGLAVTFKEDFERQKTELMALYNHFNELYVYQESVKSTSPSKSEGGRSAFERQEVIKANMSDSVLMIQNDNAVGFVTTIQGKDVVIFPTDAYDARGLSITNKFDERILFDDVYSSKDFPITIAFVKNMPEGIKKINLATEALLRESVNKNAYLYSFEMRSDVLLRNKLSAIGSQLLNLSNRITTSTKPGSILLDEADGNALGMVVSQIKYDDIGNLANQSDVKHLIKTLGGSNPTKIVVRLDKLTNWEKIDPSLYTQQSNVLDDLRSKNLQFLTFFNTTSFSRLQDVDVYRDIYEKYSAESKSKYEKSAQDRMVRDMINEILGNMRRDLNKANIANIYSGLKDDYEFNIRIRQKMIETLENSIKNKTYMSNYYFQDLKPKGNK